MSRAVAALVAPLLAFALLALILFGLVLLAYSSGLHAPFYYDDWPNIVENYQLHWRELSFGELWSSVAGSPSRRPLAVWSFGLSHYWSGLEPASFRLFNVLLHTLNAALVGVLCWHALRTRFHYEPAAPRDPLLPDPVGRRLAFSAFVAAAFFALHPLQTQSVTYIVQRMNVMATSFYLLGMLSYLRARLTTGWGAERLVWSVVLFSCYVCAMASKQIAVTLPYAIWLYEWFFLQDLSWRWARRHCAWLLLPLVVAAGILGVYLGGDLFYGYAEREFTPYERVLTQPRVLWFYLSLVALPWPSRMTLLHDFELSRGLFSPFTTSLAVLGFGVALGMALRFAPRFRFTAFALLWFLLHSAIEASFLSLMLVFEHRTYLPMVGISLALGAGVMAGSARYPRALGGAAIALLSLLAVATFQRNQLWADPERFWRDAAAKGSHPRITAQLAQIIAYVGRDAEAIPYYERVLERDPEFSGAMRGLASCYAALGRWDEAALWWRKVLVREPEDAHAHAGLGRWHQRAGRYREAWEANRRALTARPTAALLTAQARLLRLQGQPERGLRYLAAARELEAANRELLLEEALTLSALRRYGDAHALLAGEAALSAGAPLRGAGYRALAHAALDAGDEPEAEKALRAALALQTGDSALLNDLAWLLATSRTDALRNPSEALALARRAVALESGADPATLDTLAAALAASGDFAAAQEAVARALEASPDAELAEGIRARAALYRSQRAYRAPAPAARGEE